MTETADLSHLGYKPRVPNAFEQEIIDNWRNGGQDKVPLAVEKWVQAAARGSKMNYERRTKFVQALNVEVRNMQRREYMPLAVADELRKLIEEHGLKPDQRPKAAS